MREPDNRQSLGPLLKQALLHRWDRACPYGRCPWWPTAILLVHSKRWAPRETWAQSTPSQTVCLSLTCGPWGSTELIRDERHWRRRPLISLLAQARSPKAVLSPSVSYASCRMILAFVTLPARVKERL